MFNVVTDFSNNPNDKELIKRLFGSCKDIALVNLGNMPEEVKDKFIATGKIDCFLFSATNFSSDKELLKQILSSDDKLGRSTKLINLYDSRNEDNIEKSSHIGELLIDNFSASLSHYDTSDEKILHQNIEGAKNEVLKFKNQLKLTKEQTFDLVKDIAHKFDGDYTSKHIRGVSFISRKISENMGLSPEEIDLVLVGSLLHDVGKIDVPKSILNKKQKLTDEEFAILKQHTLFGDFELSDFDLGEYDEAINVASQHHERYDGHGYPRGLKGEEIDKYARIASVADATQAMFGRCYQEGKTKDALIEELNACAGTQFDPNVVKILVKILEKEPQSIGVSYDKDGKISYEVPDIDKILVQNKKSREEKLKSFASTLPKKNNNDDYDDYDENDNHDAR